jgi:Tfp pilus assembly protein PilE
MTNRRSIAGFTLVELLIGMALSVLIGGILYLLQSTGLSQVSKGTTRLSLQSELRRKIELMVNDLKYAHEVLEISPSSIKISQHRGAGDARSGDIEFRTITYTLEKIKKKSILLRSINQDAPTELFATDHIESDIFIPFYEESASEERHTPRFEPFDMKSNDSGQRKSITFIRIRMKARQMKEFVTLVTSVTLRPAHQLLYQPNWQLR